MVKIVWIGRDSNIFIAVFSAKLKLEIQFPKKVSNPTYNSKKNVRTET